MNFIQAKNDFEKKYKEKKILDWYSLNYWKNNIKNLEHEF